MNLFKVILNTIARPSWSLSDFDNKIVIDVYVNENTLYIIIEMMVSYFKSKNFTSIPQYSIIRNNAFIKEPFSPRINFKIDNELDNYTFYV